MRSQKTSMFEQVFADAEAAFFRVWIEKDASIAYPNVAFHAQDRTYAAILKKSIAQARRDWMHPSSTWAQQLQAMMPSKRDSLTDSERHALVAQFLPHFIDAFDAELVKVRDHEFAPELCLYATHPAVIEIVGNRELDIEMQRDQGITTNHAQASRVSREKADSIMALLDKIGPDNEVPAPQALKKRRFPNFFNKS